MARTPQDDTDTNVMEIESAPDGNPWKPHRFALALLATVTMLVASSAAIAAPAVRGRLVDGTAMLRASGGEKIDRGGFAADARRVPVAESSFRIEVVEGVHRGASFGGVTDAEGRFELELEGLSSLPAGRAFVFSIDAPQAMYSTAVSLEAQGDNEVRLYGTTDATRFIFNSGMEVLFTLVSSNADGQPLDTKLLDVRVRFLATNFSGELFIGNRLETESGEPRRAVFRVPLPPEAKVIEQSGETRHNRAPHGDWTITPDGWALIDDPLPPYPEAPEGVYYTLRFRVPAYQQNVFAFPLDVPLQRGMLVWSVHQDMDVSSPQLKNKQTDKRPDPDVQGGPPITWDILFGQQLPAGRGVGLVVNIDSLVLRQLNRGALKVVGGLVLGCLAAILLGLVVGRRGPRVEALLAEASGEELLERIAQLDLKYEAKKISEDEYRQLRQRLLTLARYEVPELAGESVGVSPAAAGQPAATATGGLPPHVQKLVARIAELEKSSSGDPARVQERLLLLEDLAKALREVDGGAASAGSGETR